MPRWMRKQKNGETRMRRRSQKRHFQQAQATATNHRPPPIDTGDPCPVCGKPIALYWGMGKVKFVCVRCKWEIKL